MLKDLPNTFVGLGGAFEVLLSTNLLADIFGLLTVLITVLVTLPRRCWIKAYLFRRHWFLRGLVQLLDRLLVVSQILLAAHQDDGKA